MATPSKVKVLPSQEFAFQVPNLTQESADKVSELLQKNHDEHHIYFNHDGFHNHIVHHLLTLFALGASPKTIQQQYLSNASYQRPLEPKGRKAVDMSDPANFSAHLGKEDSYKDYLSFFRSEMESKGWEAVLQEYLFKGDEKADDMLVRCYAGFLHPIIHLGFGLEFQQPAIMAEALAQTATHDNWPSPLLLGAENAAREHAAKANGAGPGPSKSLFDIIDLIQQDKKLVDSARDTDPNKIRDGILKRAPDEMVKYAAMFTVKPEELETRMAEMINFDTYFSSAAQPFPHKAIKFDFFYIHALNSSIFWPTFIKAPQCAFLSTATKCRLLEWKARTDLALYISRGSPELKLSEITSYAPKPLTSKKKQGEEAIWADVFSRVCEQGDDGHAAKLVRAIANGEKVCSGKEAEGWRVTREMWPTIARMAIDSVEGTQVHWVRNAGFESAWEGIEARPERRREASL